MNIFFGLPSIMSFNKMTIIFYPNIISGFNENCLLIIGIDEGRESIIFLLISISFLSSSVLL